MSGLVYGRSIVDGGDIPLLCNDDGSLAVTLSVIGGIGSATPVATWATLPTASADNAGQIYAITDFGYPYVMVQSTGSVWKQITHFYTTWASLPSAATFLGFVGYITNFFGGFRVIARAAAGSNYWRPLNPIKLLSYEAGDPATTLGPDNPTIEYTLVDNIALPNPGFILVGDNIILDNFHERGGTLVNGGPVFSVRMGTSGTPASNPAVVASCISGLTQTNTRSNHKALVATNTSTRTLAAIAVGINAGTTTPPLRTITDITTASQFVSLTVKSSGTAETVTPYAIEAYLLPTA